MLVKLGRCLCFSTHITYTTSVKICSPFSVELFAKKTGNPLQAWWLWKCWFCFKVGGNKAERGRAKLALAMDYIWINFNIKMCFLLFMYRGGCGRRLWQRTLFPPLSPTPSPCWLVVVMRTESKVKTDNVVSCLSKTDSSWE